MALFFENPIERSLGERPVKDVSLDQRVQAVAWFIRTLAKLQSFSREKLEGTLEESFNRGWGELLGLLGGQLGDLSDG